MRIGPGPTIVLTLMSVGCQMALFASPTCSQTQGTSSVLPKGCEASGTPGENTGLTGLCAEWTNYRGRLLKLTSQITDFEKGLDQIGPQSKETQSIVDTQKNEFQYHKNTLESILSDIEQMIQLTRLLPLLQGTAHAQASTDLANHRNSITTKSSQLLGTTGAASKGSKEQPPSSAVKEPAPSSELQPQSEFNPQRVASPTNYSPTLEPTLLTLRVPFAEPASLQQKSTNQDLKTGPSAKGTSEAPAATDSPKVSPVGAGNAGSKSDDPAGPKASTPVRLGGRVVDSQSGVGLSNATVVALCSTDPSNKRIATTDEAGFYYFSELPTGNNCLVRAARSLTSDHIADIQTRFEIYRSFALPISKTIVKQNDLTLRGVTTKNERGDKEYTTIALEPCIENSKSTDKRCSLKSGRWGLFDGYTKAGQSAERMAAAQLSPQDWDYEETSLNGISANTEGSPVTLPDISLRRRSSTVGESARILTGFEQTGASGANSAQKFFFDLLVSIPAPFQHISSWHDPNFGPPARIWGDVRITTAPQQITSSLGDFAIAFPQQIANVPVNQIAQAAEFQIGLEYRAIQWGGISRSRFFSFDRSTNQRFGLYSVASFGRITPLNPLNSIQVFLNPAPGTEPNFDKEIAALGLTETVAGKKYVAFVAADPLKFYKEYYAGFRFKTYYYDSDTDEPLRRFPATFDVVFGQNANVTGGSLRGVVARLDGFYPLPFDGVRYLYLFGSADLLVGGRLSQGTIVLQPVTDYPALPNADTFQIQSPPLSRDQYRLAVGVDIIQLIDYIKNHNQNKPSEPAN